MRILSVATTHPIVAGDGEPAYVREVNRGLARLGHEVTALLPHAPGAPRTDSDGPVAIRRFRYFAPERLERLCYNGGILPNLRRSWVARLNLAPFLAAQAAAVAREVRRFRPDLVHCHWLISSGLMGVLTGGVRHRPIVVSAHGSDVYLQNLLFQTANRFVLERAHLCTVNSRGTRTRVLRIHPGARTEIIPMGIHPEAYGKELSSAELRRRLGGGDPQLLFVGRFSRDKGIVALLEAMAILLGELPSARLGLIGFGPEERTIRAAMERLGVAHAVRVVGRVAHAEIPRWLASADLVVLPSERVEGLGVVLLESLASGTPVVGSRIGGIPDIVEHGVTGLLCRPGDPEDLAAQCLRLARDEALRRRTAEAGRRLVERRFCWEQVARRFDEVFRLLAAGTSREPPGSPGGAR